ncbi:AAA family ATPase [Sorangium sp. So ce341]|uniref:AAA family ATPase n=1 Tax=Sorangium sp. So ce341 TaxID=3133302 RepID=UPI003F64236C
MIETVSFKNFKALRDISLPLERFTVLVGPNASGKTSVLQGLAYLHSEDPWSLLEGERHPSVLRSHGTGEPIEIRCTGTWKGRVGSISFVAEEYDDEHWGMHLTVESGESRRLLHSSRWSDEDRDTLNTVRPPADLLRLDATKLAQPCYSASLVPRVEPDGDGLAAVLAEMLISRADDFRRVEDALRAVIPAVERVRLERSAVKRPEIQRVTINGQTMISTVEREYVGHRAVLDMRGAANLPAHAASEGTLIVLGILTAIISRKGAHLLLIDDVERAIHPRAIADLVAQIRKLLDVFPELQIVATSHSPYLIDHLEPEEVRLMSADEAGAVRWARLNEHPQFERWKEFMSPGEIWSMVGEDWVRERGAQPHA